ncbi:hypothetical protein DXG03_006229 [Asterophora parasitica]|uniref:Uncharacterized protein n=1 Tax=Asterophora parasitica TaxID=117018 RepID=A0A9P7KE07_9AGAR|nr:hypothetical protein DXG03_006229 [Asterophora parasitica]
MRYLHDVRWLPLPAVLIHTKLIRHARGSAVELTYNRWSTPASNLEDSANGKGSPPPNEYVLRPAWQRTGLCAAHMIFGIGIAVALLVTQTRFIRTLTIIPPSGSDGRRVFVQCAHNLRKNGLVFPYNKCSIRDGRNKTEMILRVAGERGHWHLGLEDAVIHGREIPLPEARAEVLADWGGKRAATLLSPKPKQALDRRWKSGPIRRAGGN